MRRALVLVQGDLGRSPRMQYHAVALAVNGVQVDLVGLAGVPPIDDVLTNPRISCHVVADRSSRGAGWFAHAVRGLRLLLRLSVCLARVPKPDLVLVQTPPALPCGPLVWLFARWHGARFVLDWHNLGWTILALTTGRGAAVAALRAAESWIGRRADAHLCVSEALREHLDATLRRRATVVYDRPLTSRTREDAGTRQALRARVFASAGLPSDRSILLVSPTSWTRDEDLDMLIDAADRLERGHDSLPPEFPAVLILATGFGPGRAAFDARLAARPRGACVTVRTGWVEPQEYSSLLAAADAGISLHRSSSGLDLPMKIADMFGAGLPVLALKYRALAERVRDGDTGRTFADADALAALIAELWSGGQNGTPALHALRRASMALGEDRWLDGWSREAWPALSESGA